MTNRRGVYLDGGWRAGAGVVDARIDRWTSEPLELLEIAGALEAVAAVDSAQAALARGLAVSERSAILARASARLAERAAEFATAIRRETGKPVTAARAEVERAVGTLRYAGEEARRLPGERVPLEASVGAVDMFAVTVPEARGIVAAITPFNFPLNLVCHKVGPALAAGCPIVLKPSDKAPIVAMLLAELLTESGLPAGWLNVVHGPPQPIVGDLLADDRVSIVNFTGSASVGWQLKARSPRKTHILELGSNTALYVRRDADLARAATDAVTAGFANSGQACISLQRLYVDAAVSDDLHTALTEAVGRVAAGDPALESTIVGPLVTDDAARRVGEWINDAVASGARVLAGGSHDARSVAPTLLGNVRDDDRVMREEVFGPVISTAQVSGTDEAIARINDSRYGLNTSIYTADLAAAMTFARRVHSGTVLVNIPPSFRADHMPYGGVKESGHGREGVRYAVAEHLDMKLIVING